MRRNLCPSLYQLRDSRRNEQILLGLSAKCLVGEMSVGEMSVADRHFGYRHFADGHLADKLDISLTDISPMDNSQAKIVSIEVILSSVT